MKNIEIEATKSSPKIILNPNTHIHEIRGESYPENSLEFYEPIIEWLKEYVDELGDNKAIFIIEIYYFNSSSSKALMDIFDIFEDASKEGKNITVNWIYDSDNDAILEYGEEFAEDFESLIFNLVEKE